MTTTEELPLTITPACPHEHARAKITTEPKGRNHETHIQFVCADCGAEATIFASGGQTTTGRILWTWHPPEPGQPRTKSDAAAQPQVKKPAAGPGTEMLVLTEELGITSPAGCGCKATAATMDRLGVAGCRERITDLRLTVAANWESWVWRDKLKAVTASAWKAAGLGVNPTDPVRDLLEIAIERAEAKAKQTELQT